MRICIDMSPAVHQRGGIGRYAREIAAALRRIDPDGEYVGLCDRGAYGRGEALPGGMALATHGLVDRAWRLYSLESHILSRPADGRLPAADLFHATDNVLPRVAGMRTVMTLHDLAFHIYPQTHQRLNRWYLRVAMPRMLRSADAVIAVSHATAQDAVRLYGVEEERLRVIHEGVEARFRPAGADDVARVRAAYGLPERYLLHVGTIEPRKNLLALLEAYRMLRSQGVDCPLVLVGRRGWLSESFFAARREAGLERHVRVLGAVADGDLVALYSGAAAFVFPSLYEGFGLPVLEAMACGAPVVCADNSSLPEVAGDAALLVPATDAAGLAAAVRRVLDDDVLRQDLCAKGRRRAAGFTWERAAYETLRLYRDLLGLG